MLFIVCLFWGIGRVIELRFHYEGFFFFDRYCILGVGISVYGGIRILERIVEVFKFFCGKLFYKDKYFFFEVFV